MSEADAQLASRLRGAITKRNNTRRALFDAALRLTKRGHLPTVAELAAASGVSAATLHNHFSSAHVLLAAAHEEQLRQLEIELNGLSGWRAVEALANQLCAPAYANLAELAWRFASRVRPSGDGSLSEQLQSLLASCLRLAEDWLTDEQVELAASYHMSAWIGVLHDGGSNAGRDTMFVDQLRSGLTAIAG